MAGRSSNNWKVGYNEIQDIRCIEPNSPVGTCRLRMESKTSLFTAAFRTFLYFHGRNNARLERYRKVLHNAKLPSCPRCFPRHGITIDIENSVKSCYRAISRILRWINIPVRRNAFSEYRRHGTSRYPPPPCRLFLSEQQCNERKPSHCFRICLRDRQLRVDKRRSAVGLSSFATTALIEVLAG